MINYILISKSDKLLIYKKRARSVKSQCKLFENYT